MYFNRWLDKQGLVNPYTGLLLSNGWELMSQFLHVDSVNQLFCMLIYATMGKVITCVLLSKKSQIQKTCIVCIVWAHVYEVLENAKLYEWKTDEWLSVTGGGEGVNYKGASQGNFQVMELFWMGVLWGQVHTPMHLFKPIEPYPTMSEVYGLKIKKKI